LRLRDAAGREDVICGPLLAGDLGFDRGGCHVGRAGDLLELELTGNGVLAVVGKHEGGSPESDENNACDDSADFEILFMVSPSLYFGVWYDIARIVAEA
jgi:hypothetical protein